MHGTLIDLPGPGRTQGFDALVMARRSVRDYDGSAIGLAEVARLLRAGQGVRHSSGRRTAPSAHALYPLSLHLAAGEVAGLRAGSYRYAPHAHVLEMRGAEDLRGALYRACLEDQPWVAACAAVIVVAGDVRAAQAAFAGQPPEGERGARYAFMEAGAVAQNVCLQAVEIGLGSVLVGGFEDEKVRACLGLEDAVLALIPVGRPVS